MSDVNLGGGSNRSFDANVSRQPRAADAQITATGNCACSAKSMRGRRELDQLRSEARKKDRSTLTVQDRASIRDSMRSVGESRIAMARSNVAHRDRVARSSSRY
jgi:hypothetical protein